jgi:putative peptidoglycan lipid II flippase
VLPPAEPAQPAGPRSASPEDAPPTPRRSLARSAGGIGLATLASRILGLARDQVLAALFGAGNAIDAFYVAFRIPNLLRDLFAEGAMSAAFVPTFTRRLTRAGRDEAWRLGSLVINTLLGVTGAIAVAGIVFARPLTRLFAGDYAAVEGKLELTARLTQVMFPFLPLIALAAALMGMLNSLDRFFVPALAPAMFNVATIASALLLVPLMPSLGLEPITAIAVGTVLGGLAQAALQWPLLRREGYRHRLVFDPQDEGLREILLLMGPGIVGQAATQVNLLVNTVLATGEGTGAVSWLTYAFRLMYLPIGLFGVSIATAALPRISRHAAAEASTGLKETLSSGLRLMLMLNVPATLGLMVLAGPIIELIFQYGAFTPRDTEATAIALVCYAPGLIGYSAVRIAVPTFYALRDSRTPVLVSMTTMAVNIVLNVSLVRAIGYRGLALGTALAALFNAGTLLWLLGRRLSGLDHRRIAIALGKILAASIVMAGAAAEADLVLQALLPGAHVVTRLARVSGAIGSALIVLALAARLLRIEEFNDAMGQVRNRLARRAT